MKSKGLYITGTDTGVGKTLITMALARALYQRGIKVGVAKPFASGSWDDTKLLKKSAGMPEDLKMLTPFYFKYPLAPAVSTQLEKRIFQPRSVVSKLRFLFQKYTFHLVEGIGGAAVPLTFHYDALDVAKSLKLPILIVARLSLGTLNHTFLTVNFARRKKIPIQGIILNTYPKSPGGLAEKTNPQAIARQTGIPVWGVMPYLKPRATQNPDILAQTLEKHIELTSLL